MGQSQSPTVTTQNIDPEIKSRQMQLYGDAGRYLQNTPYQPYGYDTVAGMQPHQQAAMDYLTQAILPGSNLGFSRPQTGGPYNRDPFQFSQGGGTVAANDPDAWNPNDPRRPGTGDTGGTGAGGDPGTVDPDMPPGPGQPGFDADDYYYYWNYGAGRPASGLQASSAQTSNAQARDSFSLMGASPTASLSASAASASGSPVRQMTRAQFEAMPSNEFGAGPIQLEDGSYVNADPDAYGRGYGTPNFGQVPTQAELDTAQYGAPLANPYNRPADTYQGWRPGLPTGTEPVGGTGGAGGAGGPWTPGVGGAGPVMGSGGYGGPGSAYTGLGATGPGVGIGETSQAAGYAQQLASGAPSLAPFLNPYTESVVGGALGDIERTRRLQQQQNAAGATAAQAFGGSRHGLVESETNRAALDTSARTSSQLRYAGFDAASQLAQQDASRRAQAAGLYGQLGGDLQNRVFNAGSMLGGLGLQNQDQAQRYIDADAQQFNEARNDPLRGFGLLQGILTGMPVGTSMTSYAPQGSRLQGFGQGALGGAGVGSAFGPWGAGIGGALGGLLGLF